MQKSGNFQLEKLHQKIPTFKYADKTILEHKMRLYANGLVVKVYYSAITNINKPGKKMKNEFKKKAIATNLNQKRDDGSKTREIICSLFIYLVCN